MNELEKAIKKSHNNLESGILHLQIILNTMKHKCRYYDSETSLQYDLDAIIKLANELKAKSLELSKLHKDYEESE
jgi:hypothetical protein